ncbi:ABC transporter substrate-binding protein [Pseudonocardia xinjiangensis]|uniref:Carbohydrate ABC transporter substrate-binding protein n=1 Tax=Pseudonocardia xinjiangensis TaxID=75289 RepID=A0ABX1RFP5_9PSEU|nr:ABC transporter substrate-binding protein [Pseudonocardia xinjiangensis]NMH79212.1 carbohydrate ABC transporter substrate-binding protein [Pseudonocardia xinjiangensis]
MRATGTRAAAGLIGAAVLLLTACGGGSDSQDGPVELRFSWWGNEQRAQATERAIAAFEAAHPGITVTGEYADFNAYFDRIATSVAANDAPDVITMGGAYPREYGDRGALLDLAEVSQYLDLGKLDEAATSNGRFDGVQYGVPTGVNSYGVVVNPAVFEAAGVSLPDDTTWTWADFERIAAQISAAAPEGTYGAEDPTSADALDLYSRQSNEGLYTPDGKLAISAATVTTWWEMTSRMRNAGATPPATLTVELGGQPAPEQTLMGRGLSGMRLDWSNRLAAMRTASGAPLVMMRAPSESAGRQPGMWLQASQLYTISSRTEHPEEAAQLVDFLVNDPAAGREILTDRGIPANPEVRDAISGAFNENQKVEAEFIDRISEQVGPPLVVGPVGSTDTRSILERIGSDVLFDRATPADAAARFVDEVTAAIS